MLNNIPPKQTLGGTPVTPPSGATDFEHLPPVDPAAGALPPHGLVLRDAAAQGDANSFPVLKAFQDYLEMERQQARKRLVTLTVFFVSLMTLVVTGFIIAFIFMFGNMAKREDRLLEVALQQKKEDAATPTPAALAAQQAAREFQAAAMNLQTNVGTQVATMGAVASKLDSKVAEQNAEMVRMREALAAMQKENDKLRSDLPKLALEAARKTPSPAAVSGSAPTAAARPSTVTMPVTTTAGTPAASAARPPKGYDETVLLIRTRDSDNSIPWRAFVPK
jgi:hypothetical protein